MKRCASLLMLVSLGVPATVRASTSYPPHLRSVVGLSYTPDCTLCHSSELGGDGTAVKPFGVSMLRLGALGNDNLASLTSALEADRRDRVDSDEDEVADIDELRQGSDPNRGVDGEAPLTPMTGCTLSTRTSESDGSSWAALLVASIAFAARRRRR
jgi:MYXO-CTERM domain-containing protein